MTMFKKAMLAIAAVSAGLIAAAPANAMITTFASFNATTNGNIVWVNDGTGGDSATYRSNGTGGTLYTTTSAAPVVPSASVAGGVAVTFTFLNALNAFVANLPATFTLNATTVATPAITVSGFKIQNVTASGNFSFVSTAPVMINNVLHASGQNLLSATFTDLSIFGQAGGTSGSFGGSANGGSTISFTSDLLVFPNSLDRDISLSLSSIISLNSNVNAGLNNAANRALRSFRATATGSFSADPTPTIVANIPEPESWAMFVIGFGMVGISYRRRKSAVVSA